MGEGGGEDRPRVDHLQQEEDQRKEEKVEEDERDIQDDIEHPRSKDDLN